MVPSPYVQEHVDAMQTSARPTAEVVNLGEVYDFLFGPPDSSSDLVAQGVHLPVEGRDLSGMPALRLRAADDLTYDHFIMGLPLVSGRLAGTLALDPGQAQLLEVDCSDCPPEVQAMGYRVLNVLAYGNPLDRRRTGPGGFVDLTTQDGETFAWVPPPVGPATPPPTIAWNRGFTSPAPLFIVPGSAWTLASEALAGRIAGAGFKDVAFIDLENDGRIEGSAGPLRFRERP
jgi:hypothetical protein